MMTINPQEVHNQYTFNSYCKRSLKNEVCDFYREIKRRKAREIDFSDLDPLVIEHLPALDIYPMESHIFHVLGYEIVIQSDLLADLLQSLPEIKREILLLYHIIDMTDKEVGELLGMPRPTVQYQRAYTEKLLRTKLEEYRHGEKADT